MRNAYVKNSEGSDRDGGVREELKSACERVCGTEMYGGVSERDETIDVKRWLNNYVVDTPYLPPPPSPTSALSFPLLIRASRSQILLGCTRASLSLIFILRTRTVAVETFSSSGCCFLVLRTLSIDRSGRGTHGADGRVRGRGGYKEMNSFS